MKTITRIFALLALAASAVAADITKIVAVGQTVTMTASADGSTPMTFQWLKEGTQVFTGQTYVIAPLAAEHTGVYTVRVFNAFGVAESNDRVILTLGIPPSPPTITVALANMTVKKGEDVLLGVQVAGDDPKTFQWRKGVSNIIGATQPFFLIRDAKVRDAGTYAVRVVNPNGWTESGMKLTVANR